VSDARDMIYAYMGLATDANQIGQELKLDYNKTVCQISEELALS
jgi:hypothetical protein